MAPTETCLRTADERFSSLPGFDFFPHYREDLPGFEGLRVHYVDEGPRDAARTIFCLHGQPTWSYLYRKMIPVFVRAGHRVVAPDLFGFGRSDKPTDPDFYTFTRHRAMLGAFVSQLGLTNITLVVQDWGGLLGLTLPHENPELYSRALIMNTSLGTGDVPLPQGFLDWRAFSNSRPDMDIAALMARAVPILTPEEASAYAAPYPDVRYKAGVQRFPNLVPDHPDADGAAVSRTARAFFQNQWQGDSFMAIGMRDPVLGPPVMRWLHGFIRGCPPPLEVTDGGHFLQEWGEPIAVAALKAWGEV
ncbi:MAG: haloalkane dehalogenase [Burkholderiaceae bacterium]